MSDDYYKEGDWNAVCSMCGRKRKASELVKNWQGQWRCPKHNEPRHPQDFVQAKADVMTVPFDQPGTMGNISFNAFCTPAGLSALPDAATPGCVRPDFVSPAFDPAINYNNIITVTNFTFGAGNGVQTAFPLSTINNIPMVTLTGLSAVYINDWKGNQLQYSTPRTNHAWPSNDFTSANWGKTAGIIVTSNYAAAPDGSMAAQRVQFAAGNDYFYCAFAGAPNPHPQTIGLWLKSNTGVNQVLAFGDNATFGSSITVTPQWKLFSVPTTIGNAVYSGLLQAGGRPADILAYEFNIWDGLVATSDIPTTTAPVTVTDYTLSRTSIITFSSAPALNSTLSWSGSYTIGV